MKQRRSRRTFTDARRFRADEKVIRAIADPGDPDSWVNAILECHVNSPFRYGFIVKSQETLLINVASKNLS
jgi:hypothetical protein